MIVNPGLLRVLGLRTRLYTRVKQTFASGSDGFIYDPSDISTLYQDSGRTTPVTAVTNPVGSISDKSGNLNHAIQATAAARPTWTNRVNQLTYSEDLSNAAWTKRGTTNPVQGATDPYGGSTGWTLTVAQGGGDDIYNVVSGLSASISLASSFWLKKVTNNKVLVIANPSGTGNYQIDLSLLSDNYEWITPTHQAVTVVAGFVATVGGAAGVMFYSLDNTAIEFIYGGSQQELGTTATRYQRVTTATDFDTAGFPYYLSFLGTDDSLTSATGGGGSAGFFWCGVIEPTGGAGTLQTLFADNGTNTGYKVQKDTSNKLSFSAGNNTAFTTLASTATLAVGTKALLTVWDDGTNLNVQINSAAPETVARPAVVAGTAGYTLGKDNGAASSFFIGNQYPSVYFKGTGGTDAEVAAAQAYCRAMGGM